MPVIYQVAIPRRNRDMWEKFPHCSQLKDWKGDPPATQPPTISLAATARREHTARVSAVIIRQSLSHLTQSRYHSIR